MQNEISLREQSPSRIFKKKFGMTPTEYRKSFALFCPF